MVPSAQHPPSPKTLIHDRGNTEDGKKPAQEAQLQGRSHHTSDEASTAPGKHKEGYKEPVQRTATDSKAGGHEASIPESQQLPVSATVAWPGPENRPWPLLKGQ